MKKISVVSGTYNEEENVVELVERVFGVAEKFPQYEWEYIIIDNNSKDKTREVLRELAENEPRLKLIFNIRNFGQIRSSYYALMEARGDAVIYLAADLQDPPELIEKFVEKWEAGAKVVAAIKTNSEESRLVFMARKCYYSVITRLADVDLLKNFTGFGLYDKEVYDHLRKMEDPYPYQRGQISELGYPVERVEFTQPKRKRGFSTNNLYSLYDIAMLGITSHTKIPLRLAAIAGFICSCLAFAVGLFYLLFKLFFWNEFPLGQAPTVVGLFFMGSVQLFFIGILGEYIGAIHTKLTKRPLVVEKERINF